MKVDYASGPGKGFKDDFSSNDGTVNNRTQRTGDARPSTRGRADPAGAAGGLDHFGSKPWSPSTGFRTSPYHAYGPHGFLQPPPPQRGRPQSPLILDRLVCDGLPDTQLNRSNSQYNLGENLGVRQTRSAPDSQLAGRGQLPADAWGKPMRTGGPARVLPDNLSSSFVSIPIPGLDGRSNSGLLGTRQYDSSLLGPSSPSSTTALNRPRSSHHPLKKLQSSIIFHGRGPHPPQGDSPPQLSPIGSPNAARRRLPFPSPMSSHGSTSTDSLLDDHKLVGRIPSAPAMTPLPLHQLPDYSGNQEGHSFRPGSARNRLVDAIRSKDVHQLMNAIEMLKDRDGRVRGINDLHPVSNWSPLHEALIVNDMTLVSVLLSVGADPNIGHPTRGPPLLHAAAFGERDVAELLLKAGADVNATDVAGYTAMHYACAGGHVETARTLVMFNANVQLRNLDGEVPLDIARPEVVKALFGPSTPSSASPGHGRSPFANSPISPNEFPNRPGSGNSSKFNIPDNGSSPGLRPESRQTERVSGFIPDLESPPELHLPPTVFGGGHSRPALNRPGQRPPVGLQDIINSFLNEDQDLINTAESIAQPHTLHQFSVRQHQPQSSGGTFHLSTPSQQDSTAHSRPPQSVFDSNINPICLDEDMNDAGFSRPFMLEPAPMPSSSFHPPPSSSTNRRTSIPKLKICADSFPPLVQDHSPTDTPQGSPRSPRAPYINNEDTRPERISQAEKALASTVGYPSIAAKVHARKIFSTSVEVTTGPIQWTQGELLGEGGYGKVYAGLNQETGELMAVKMIEISGYRNVHRQEQQLLELQRELEMYKSLKHKHVVGYIDAHFDPTALRLYIFLEYVPGGSIASMLERFGPFKEELVRNYTRQLLTGLEYLHGSRIVHRDLKGGNVLVSRDGTVKLADFGASKAYRDATLNEAMKSLKGSAFWMAPEVIHKTGHGRPADIWSMGCTVIEMLTGMHPWPQFDNQMTAMFNIAKTREGPPRPDGISEAARDFLDKCLCFEPSQRWSASELLVHPFVNGSDVVRRASSVSQFS